MAPQIIVHWLSDSRSQRILWLLEELHLPYEVIAYHRDWDTFQIPADGFESVYKLKRFPALVLTDAEAGFPTPTTLAESGAIFETLLALYGNRPISSLAVPTDPKLAARHRFWLHWCEGTAMYPLIFYLVLNRVPKKFSFVLRPLAALVCNAIITGFILPSLRKLFEFMEEELGSDEYFVGNAFGACDIMLSTLYDIVLAVPPNPTFSAADFPRLEVWYERITAREACRAAEKRGNRSSFVTYFT